MGEVQGGISYVNVPLNSLEVQEFKKEMKNLLSDPIGLSEQFDPFLGQNLFTWKELNLIIKTLFFPKDRQISQTAGINIWDRENNQGPIGVAAVALVSSPQGETEAELKDGDTWWDEPPGQAPPEKETTVSTSPTFLFFHRLLCCKSIVLF